MKSVISLLAALVFAGSSLATVIVHGPRINPSSTPRWDGELFSQNAGSGTRISTTFTLTVGYSGTSPLVLLISCPSRTDSDPVTSITDSRSNSYTIQQQGYNSNASFKMVLATAMITTPLVSGDTITVTFTNNANSGGDRIFIEKTANCTAVETSIKTVGSNTGFTSSTTLSHVPSVQLGLMIVKTTSTVSSFTWTYIGAAPLGNSSYPFYSTTASAGSRSVSASISPSAGYAVGWVSLY